MSLGIHLLAVAFIVFVPLEKKPKPKPVEVVFYTAPPEERPAPPPLLPDPEPELPEPEPEPLQPKPLPEPKPEPEPEPRVVELPKPKPVQVAEVKPKPEPPKPIQPKPEPIPPKVVKTNVFETAEAKPEPEARERKLRTHAFAQPEAAAEAAPMNRTVSKTNLLDSTARQPEAAPQRRSAPATGSFAQEDAPVASKRPEIATTSKPGAFETVSNRRPQGTSRPRKVISSTGFGQGDAEAAPGPGGDRSVRSGQFGDAERVATAPKRREKAVVLENEVQIVSKPKPIYTEEGRRLRIEGEVVLEVVFHADGRLKVLRVVRGLGHGLDEAAKDAVNGISFKPARSEGKPIDFTATLRVVFQLA